ncbi:MAG: hypothetical protein L0220_31215, partial [Acidobacteria bacterium]|nr:hypothetical protein [Acidobacteriota bacterium]
MRAVDRIGGKTVVCIASGPSLTREDCEKIERTQLLTVAVNNSWQIARFCQILYAGDDRWWTTYYDKIDIDVEKWTCAVAASRKYDLYLHRAKKTAYNSGLRALQLVIEHGAKRVILLGYDCRHDR